MAYVEIRKAGKLITRRPVDEQKAQTGLRVRLGAGQHVRVAIGSPATAGDFAVCVFAGEIPEVAHPTDTGGACPETTGNEGQTRGFSTCGAGDWARALHERPEIEGYQLIEPIGQGGMGTVWRAEQLSTRREVALKLMICHSAKPEQAEMRFQREVELTARLDHPNIARIYDSGLRHGVCYYAMELIDGMPLDR